MLGVGCVACGPGRVGPCRSKASHRARALVGKVSRRPGPPPGRDAPVEERLEWVEQAVDTALRELDSETLRHDQDVERLDERVARLRAELQSDLDTLRQRVDEARVPGVWSHGPRCSS